MPKKFVAIADVLGFKSIIKSSRLEDVYLEYSKLLNDVDRRCKIHTTVVKTTKQRTTKKILYTYVNHVIFSDTILLWTKNEKKGHISNVDLFINVISILLCASIKMNLPLRIGIAYGDCIIDKKKGAFIGDAIISAYETEQAQDWVGVAFHKSCHDSLDWSNLTKFYLHGGQAGPAIKYSIPIKQTYTGNRPEYSTDWPTHAMLYGLDPDIMKRYVDKYANGPHSNRWILTYEYFISFKSYWEHLDFMNKELSRLMSPAAGGGEIF